MCIIETITWSSKASSLEKSRVLSIKSIHIMIRLKSVTALTPQLGDVKADGQKLSGNASVSSNHG